MPRPLVSILLPCRNVAATLDECLDSIAGQTLPTFEVIAVDDHSEDGTDRRLEAMAIQDPRYRFFRSPAVGLVPALNFGLTQSSSALVARMDGDDRMHPRRLELQYEYLVHHPEISVLGSRVQAFPQEELTDGFRAYVRWQNGCVSESAIANDIYLESPLAHPSVMFRKQAILEAGGYRNGLFPEDYELWLRLLKAGQVLTKLPQTLISWRDSAARTSRRDPRCSREAFDRVRAHYLAQDRRVLGHRNNLAIWGAGRNTRKRAQHLLDRGFRPIAWIDIDPRKIGNRIDGVPVVEPRWLKGADRPFVLSYVAVHGARECIEGELDRLG
ncbi:MAG: glycosyltransferase, partial [Pseudomonadota bacterium]|nr:glycosyltransferase [Pseudomonadota bacterium]